jgi:AcrR family transcriptional regulator
MASATDSGRPVRPPLPRRPGDEPPDRRRQVRTAALELFAAQGYRTTTVDDIGERVGIRGPSVYKHYRSKQELLVEIMVETMEVLTAAQRGAIRAAGDVREQLRCVVEAHVRYHAEHTREAFVGNREIDNLAEPYRTGVLRKRAEYDRRLRRLIEKGVREGAFQVDSPRLAAYAIIDLGTGVSVWYRASGAVPLDDLVAFYAELALRMVGVRRPARRR